jgi:hypothetical protein
MKKDMIKSTIIGSIIMAVIILLFFISPEALFYIFLGISSILAFTACSILLGFIIFIVFYEK